MKRFLKDRNASVMSMFALMLPVFLLLMAAILDGGRYYVTGQDLQRYLDASTLAAANTGLTINDGVNPPYAIIPDPDGPNAASNNFYSNYNPNMKSKVDASKTTFVINPEGSANLSNGKIHVVGSVEWRYFLGTFLAPLAGKDTVKVTRDSWATVRPST